MARGAVGLINDPASVVIGMQALITSGGSEAAAKDFLLRVDADGTTPEQASVGLALLAITEPRALRPKARALLKDHFERALATTPARPTASTKASGLVTARDLTEARSSTIDKSLRALAGYVETRELLASAPVDAALRLRLEGQRDDLKNELIQAITGLELPAGLQTWRDGLPQGRVDLQATVHVPMNDTGALDSWNRDPTPVQYPYRTTTSVGRSPGTMGLVPMRIHLTGHNPGSLEISVERLPSDRQRIVRNNDISGGQLAGVMAWKSALGGTIDAKGRFSLNGDNEIGAETGLRSSKTGAEVRFVRSSTGLTISGSIADGQVKIDQAGYGLELRTYHRLAGGGPMGLFQEVIRERSAGGASAPLPIGAAHAPHPAERLATLTNDDLISQAGPLGDGVRLGTSSFKFYQHQEPATVEYLFGARDPRLFHLTDAQLKNERVDTYDGRTGRSPSYTEVLPELTKVLAPGTDPRMFRFIARCAELMPKDWKNGAPAPPKPTPLPPRCLPGTYLENPNYRLELTIRNNLRVYRASGLTDDGERLQRYNAIRDGNPVKRIREYLANPLPVGLSGAEALPDLIRMAQAGGVQIRDVRVTLSDGSVARLTELPTFPEDLLKVDHTATTVRRLSEVLDALKNRDPARRADAVEAILSNEVRADGVEEVVASLLAERNAPRRTKPDKARSVARRLPTATQEQVAQSVSTWGDPASVVLLTGLATSTPAKVLADGFMLAGIGEVDAHRLADTAATLQQLRGNALDYALADVLAPVPHQTAATLELRTRLAAPGLDDKAAALAWSQRPRCRLPAARAFVEALELWAGSDEAAVLTRILTDALSQRPIRLKDLAS